MRENHRGGLPIGAQGNYCRPWPTPHRYLVGGSNNKCEINVCCLARAPIDTNGKHADLPSPGRRHSSVQRISDSSRQNFAGHVLNCGSGAHSPGSSRRYNNSMRLLCTVVYSGALRSTAWRAVVDCTPRRSMLCISHLLRNQNGRQQQAHTVQEDGSGMNDV